MKLQVQPLDIKVGQNKVILNTRDAMELGLRAGDRVRVKDGGILTAIVETTHDMVPQGKVALYQECCEKLGDVCPSVVDVIPASRPSSINFIKKKMDGKKLSQEEISLLVQDIVRENLTDIELSAFVTANYIHGFDADETEWLTRSMIDTGERIEFDTHPVMDKHSIGGVPGNKISLLVVPIVAAAGLLIPKTSSRAITGAAGTADIMEVLSPVAFTASEIKEMSEKVGGVIVWGGATNIAPADDKLIRVEYPLSIDPHSQLLASIMAKKGAVGADSVLIDIPTGTGTKVNTLSEGRKIARDLVELGERLGMRVECAMTYGSSPVGRTIGPTVEAKEALRVLETSKGPNSLIEKSTGIAGILLEMGGVASKGHGKQMAMEILHTGKALEKLREIIEIQGGDPHITSKDLSPGEHMASITSPADGYVVELSNKKLIEIARLAGAPLDKGAGIILHKKRGEIVKAGDKILTIHAEKNWKLEKALHEAENRAPFIIEGMLLERYPSYTTM